MYKVLHLMIDVEMDEDTISLADTIEEKVLKELKENNPNVLRYQWWGKHNPNLPKREDGEWQLMVCEVVKSEYQDLNSRAEAVEAVKKLRDEWRVTHPQAGELFFELDLLTDHEED